MISRGKLLQIRIFQSLLNKSNDHMHLVLLFCLHPSKPQAYPCSSWFDTCQPGTSPDFISQEKWKRTDGAQLLSVTLPRSLDKHGQLEQTHSYRRRVGC